MIAVTLRRSSLASFALVVCAAMTLSACSSDDKEPSAASSGAEISDTPIPAAPGGQEVADLQARWWGWAASQPEASNPVADMTGQQCAQGQPDDVWFVAGTFGGDAKRTCTVPAGRTLAGPLLNFTADTAEQCEEHIAASDGEVVLDGSPVDVKKVGPEAITFAGVAGNPVTKNADEVSTQGCGLWFTLAPLAPGAHKLAISGVSNDFKLSVEYTLNVG
ncbi:signal protein [Yinghuangia sp. YIM S09857]|uniref:signal protein n=1 Tax=Yinghuangia sp. YIM S09857 TaxID=3436929 RepID=UPI003F5385FB